ncbi:alkylresorcinol/alkylpyrone synthase [Alkalibacillus flavidus]|uniref:Alkylresorcinol/alkylpyrone synthase n=1 Tax=Alkalibacillus flavidus TaxID=546021 RepID=A0ABV2KRU4_9BACI
MSTIASIGTSLPQYTLSQPEAKQFIRPFVSDSLTKYLSVFDESGIDHRYFAADREWLTEDHGFKDRQTLFESEGVVLAVKAVEHCLAGWDDLNLNAIITVTSTGVLTPSLDVNLMNRLHLSPSLKRMPLFGLGCAGGAAGLSRAYDYLTAHPDQAVLLVCCELASTAFHPQNITIKDIVGSAIFSDGAAAVLLMGDEHLQLNRIPSPKLKIRATDSNILPDSMDIMGWNIEDNGFHVVFSRRIPSIVSSFWQQHVTDCLSAQHTSVDQLDFAMIHPGGRKILDEIQRITSFDSSINHAREVLRQYGNMSSATVLFVLRAMVNTLKQSQQGILTALGPGFASELVLLEVE